MKRTIWRSAVVSTALIAALAISACGSSGDSGTASTSATAPTTLKKGDGEITVITWETYHDDPWVKQAEKDLGLKINITRVGSVDEMYAKARAGGTDADLYLVDSGSIKRYKDAGLIAPIDRQAITRAGNINLALDYAKTNVIDGELWAVPYNWGIQPMVFNKAAVPAAARTTWKTLWDPKYKGQVMIPDDAYITLPMVALAAGVPPFSWSAADYQTIKSQLDKLRPQVKTLTKSFNDQETTMVSGDAKVGYGQTYAFVSKDPKLGLSFPKEGTPFWLDNYFFSPKGAQDQDVYNFVNYTLTEEWQCRFANQTLQNGILPATLAKKCFSAKAWAGEGGNLVSKLTPELRKSFVLLQAPADIDKRLELWNAFKAGT